MATASALVRLIHIVFTALLFGTLVFSLFVLRPVLSRAQGLVPSERINFDRRLLRFARATLFLIFLSGLVALWLQIMTISDLSFIPALNPAVIAGVLSGTRYGLVWSSRMALLLILAVILLRLKRTESATTRVAALCAATVLTGAPVFSGHAAAGEGVSLVLLVLVGGLHLLAASAWMGGLVTFAWLLLWLASVDRDWCGVLFRRVTQRFSILGLVCVVVLIATGGLNAWSLVGGISPLFGTTYGQLLLVKLSLLLPLILIAAFNLLRLKPRILARQADTMGATGAGLLHRLRRNVNREAILGACILFVVSMMSVTPPARHVQPEWPFSFRWSWNAANMSAKVRAQLSDAYWLAGAGLIGLVAVLVLRRRPRYVLLGLSAGAIGYGGWIYHSVVAIDAYPTTYLRPTVPYNVISVASGAYYYREICATCHGVGGFGDGPNGKGFLPKPADLTARHSSDHTAGDLFWWLTHGVKRDGALTPMPGFGASLPDEERWDMINFLRALSAAERARQMSALVEPDPWLVAPDFVYRTINDESGTLKDFRGNHNVMLVLFTLPDSIPRIVALDSLAKPLESKNVKILLVPKELPNIRSLDGKLRSLSVVTDGSRETFDAYALYRRSFSEQGTQPDPPVPPHMEFLIDRQGYVRARWIPRDGPGWDNLDKLWRDIDRLNQEKPSAPAPDDHVH